MQGWSRSEHQPCWSGGHFTMLSRWLRIIGWFAQYRWFAQFYGCFAHVRESYFTRIMFPLPMHHHRSCSLHQSGKVVVHGTGLFSDSSASIIVWDIIKDIKSHYSHTTLEAPKKTSSLIRYFAATCRLWILECLKNYDLRHTDWGRQWQQACEQAVVLDT